MNSIEEYMQNIYDYIHGRENVSQRKAAIAFEQMSAQLSLLQREWKPIESAPKEGRILLLFPNSKISVGYWDIYYSNEGRGYERGLSAWIEPCSGERLCLHYDDPVAWMPTPPGDSHD